MDPNGTDRTRVDQRLPGWIPVVLVAAMTLGVGKQLFGLVLQVFPGAAPGNGGVSYISLSLRLAQWSIWPDYTDVAPMVLVPAAALLWFTVSRVEWTPTPGWWTRRVAALLLAACSALALARGVGVLLWSSTATSLERANIGLTSENGAVFIFNSGLFGQLWFAAVGGVLTWCFVVAGPAAKIPAVEAAAVAEQPGVDVPDEQPRPEPLRVPPPEVFRRPVDGHPS
jgi:hypothetical protein